MKFTQRCAEQKDVEAIFLLLDHYAQKKIVLARSRENIREHLANFMVAETDHSVVGCCAARAFSADLYEIRSLAVSPEYARQGIGRMLVEAQQQRLCRVNASVRLFALTLTPEFFLRLGFATVPKERFPEKIWSDCANCPKKEKCDEIAVLKECTAQ